MNSTKTITKMKNHNDVNPTNIVTIGNPWNNNNNKIFVQLLIAHHSVNLSYYNEKSMSSVTLSKF